MSYWRLYYHVVWATKGRQTLLTALVEPFVYRMLEIGCRKLGGQSLAVNGMPDHIHLVAMIPPTVRLAEFVGRLKGSSSRYVKLEYELPYFEWQDGYGVFTISRRNLTQAIEYVQRQKEHHLAGTLIAPLERMAEDDDGPLSFGVN